MKPTKPNTLFQRSWLTLAAFAVSACCACAQSSDAIIDKLVEKGILTVKEANDLKEEAEKNFTQSYSTKSGLADWAAALKFNGDFRARYDTVFSDATAVSGGATNQFRARNRFR